MREPRSHWGSGAATWGWVLLQLGELRLDGGTQVLVDVGPVLVDALLGVRGDTLHGAGDVLGETLLGGVIEHLAVKGAGLAEVVILRMLDVGGADQVGA